MSARIDARRIELVVLDLISHGSARCGAGFGQYPLGTLDAVERLMPLCDTEDPAYPEIASALARWKERLSL